jgi:hypothetical protein
MTKPTKRRRSSHKPVAKPTAFPDDKGRACFILQGKGGPDYIILADERAAIRPYQTTGKVYWNDDGDRDADGTLIRSYLKTTAREPGRRGPKNTPRGIPVSRLIAMAMMRKHGGRFPKKGYEVAFVDLDRRHDLRPENLKLRPRGDNKHWVNAVRAFGPEFDPEKGFDEE